MAILNFRKVPDRHHKPFIISAVKLGVSMESLALRYIEDGLKRGKHKRGGQ